MFVGFIESGVIRFPGRAGQLQAEGVTSELIAELGENYNAYHAYLADAVARVGHRPRPDEFASNETYLAAWSYVHHLVLAEAFIRNCQGHYAHGRPLDGTDPGIPLLDERDRLVSLMEFRR